MKRICYLRISTQSQDNEMQRVHLERYLKAHGIEAEFYEEVGSGGSTKKREVFNCLMREVSRGEVSHIYVFKLDRWARNTKDFLVTHEIMERVGCKFISIQDNIDFSTPIGRMFAQMLAVFAEFERGQISSRVKAGRQAAAARGVKFGHPKARPIDMSKVRELMSSGKTVRDIAKLMGVGKSVLYDRLARVS